MIAPVSVHICWIYDCTLQYIYLHLRLLHWAEQRIMIVVVVVVAHGTCLPISM